MSPSMHSGVLLIFALLAGAAAEARSPGEQATLVGTLDYRPLGEGRSEAAYHGVTFFLRQDDGEEQALWATKEVSANALHAFKGQRVEVVGTWIPPKAPEPHESAPMGPEGVLPRMGKWAVQRVKLVSAPTKGAVSGPRPGEERHFRGVLEYRPLGEGRSEAAYHGVTFFLRTKTEEIPLWATQENPADTLYGYKGQEVEVVTTWMPPVAPHPQESAPMGPDGQVQPRRGKWAVKLVYPPLVVD